MNILRLRNNKRNKCNVIVFDFRFTPPPEQQAQGMGNSNRLPTTNELPAKLQQMDGPSGPIRKSTKTKW